MVIIIYYYRLGQKSLFTCKRNQKIPQRLDIDQIMMKVIVELAHQTIFHFIQSNRNANILCNITVTITITAYRNLKYL